MATALQGIVNRNANGDNFFYVYEGSEEIAHPRDFYPDQFWLQQLSRDGEYLDDYEQVHVSSQRFYEDLVLPFKSVFKGLALWDEAIPALSNVASTAASAEDYLPVRSGGEQYEELKAKLGSVPELDLGAKFAGNYSRIPDTDIQSTGRKKMTSICGLSSAMSRRASWTPVMRLIL